MRQALWAPVVVFAAGAFQLSATSAIAQSNAAPAQPAAAEKLSEREKRAPIEVQNKLIKARQEIIEQKKNYQVGLTSVSAKPLKQLTGEIDDPMTREERIIHNRKAEDALDMDEAVKSEYYRGEKAYKRAKPAPKVCDVKMKKFDWRIPKKMTPVRDQNPCGSCWAFSAWGAYESSYLIVNRRSVDGSEQDLIDCAIANDGSDAGSCDGGLSWKAFEHMMRVGAVNEKTRSYKAVDQQCKSPSKRPIRAVAWGFVNPAVDLPTVAELKKALCDYGALSVSMRVVDPAYQDYKKGVYDEYVEEPYMGSGHAVVLVGWDDRKDNGKGKKGAWLIKNSWGEGWGEKGYGWMSYGSNLIGRTARWIKAFEDKSLPAYKALRPDLIAAPASSPVATGGAAAPADAASSGTQR
jgi:C1A family cysteine protease